MRSDSVSDVVNAACLLLAASLIGRQPSLPPPIGIEIPVAAESAQPQRAPQLFAHAAGVRVLWLEGNSIRVADFDRSGRRIGDAETIEHDALAFRADARGTDTVVAWQRGDAIAAMILDRDRSVVTRFPVVTLSQVQLTSVGCRASECAIGWSLPYQYPFTKKGFVARYAPNGVAIGNPIAVPDFTHRPAILTGERDYLVILRGYDIGRPVFCYALLRDGTFHGLRQFTGRSSGASGAWNGREWLLVSWPLGPYTRDVTTTRVDSDGELLPGSSSDEASDRNLIDFTWNGTVWVAALSGSNWLYAATIDAAGVIGKRRVLIAHSVSRHVNVSSAGDGVTWFAYEREGRVVLRATELF